MHTALERTLGRKGFLCTLGPREAIFAHTSAVGATAIATALAIARACPYRAAGAGEASLTHACPVLCSTMSATHGSLTVHTSPSSGTLACTLDTRAMLAAHLGPTRRLAAVIGAETLCALAFAGNALAIAAAVLGAPQVSASWTSEVG